MQYCVDFHIKQKIYLGWYLQKPIWSVDILKQPAWFMTFMKFMMCYNSFMTEVPSYWDQSIDLRNFPNIDSNLSHEWVKSFKIIPFFHLTLQMSWVYVGGKWIKWSHALGFWVCAGLTITENQFVMA